MRMPVMVVELINAIPTAFELLFFVAVFVLLPMAIFSSTRPAAVGGLIVTAALSSLLLLLASGMQVFSAWGLPGVIYAALFFGLGLVPAAFAAALFHGTASELIGLSLMLLLPVCSGLGAILIKHGD